MLRLREESAAQGGAPLSWDEVASQVPGRSADACSSRYRTLQRLTGASDTPGKFECAVDPLWERC
jgi:hypothetical protein